MVRVLATAHIRYKGPEDLVGDLTERLEAGDEDVVVRRIGEPERWGRRDIAGIVDNIVADLIVLGSAAAMKDAVASFEARWTRVEIRLDIVEDDDA